MKDSRKRKSHTTVDAVALVDEVLAKAARAGASDVHFEPTGQELLIRFRLDGALTTIESLPAAVAENVVSRLKVLGGLLTYRNDIPQEGRIELGSPDGAEVFDRRLAVFPTIHGQRAVVRLFLQEPALMALERLGLPEAILDALTNLAGATQGMLLLTGPAGSGKSTTLAAMLRHIVERFPGKSLVSLEDPVERRIAGVTQVQISPQGPMTFPTALRSLLRQDPEVLMIGEIRDAETARIASEAGLTGHLLLTTMHSGTPGAALLRLLEMGVEPYQVTSSVSAVVNQRLVRKLCLHCRRQRGGDGVWEAVGCEECFGTGFQGRALIAEIVLMDGELRRAVLAKADLDELRGILDGRGHMTLRQDGGRLVGQGITTPDELVRACGPDASA
jgi:general secretion pathway protein E